MLSTDFDRQKQGTVCELCPAQIISSQSCICCIGCNSRRVHTYCVTYIYNNNNISTWCCSNCRDGRPKRSADPNLSLRTGSARARKPPTTYRDVDFKPLVSQKKMKVDKSTTPTLELNSSSSITSKDTTPPTTTINNLIEEEDIEEKQIIDNHDEVIGTTTTTTPSPIIDHAAVPSSFSEIKIEDITTNNDHPFERNGIRSSTRLSEKKTARLNNNHHEWTSKTALSSLAGLAIQRGCGPITPKRLKIHLIDGGVEFKGVTRRNNGKYSVECGRKPVGEYETERSAAIAYARASMDPKYVGAAIAEKELHEAAAESATNTTSYEWLELDDMSEADLNAWPQMHKM